MLQVTARKTNNYYVLPYPDSVWYKMRCKSQQNFTTGLVPATESNDPAELQTDNLTPDQKVYNQNKVK